MQLLLPGSVLFHRFEVVEIVHGAGQSFGYRGVDLRAPAHRPWLKNVFLKQYHDLIPGSSEADSLSSHFDALRSRLGERAGYISLPLHLGEAANSLVAVYPWIEGMTLRDQMLRGLSREERVRLAMALVKTTGMMHKKGIAHLDLKPSNVVIQQSRKDGKLYARMIDLDAARIDGIGLRRVVIGTDEYMSPEHYLPSSFGDVSIKSDIFTLGIMLCELLFSVHPFKSSPWPYREAICKEDFFIPSNDFHYRVVQRIIDCLRVDSDLRPQAGWIQARLTEHYESLFSADRNEDRWSSSSKSNLLLMVEGMDPEVVFKRTYYENISIGRNEFRGSNLNLGAYPLIAFVFGSGRCLLRIVGSYAEVALDGRTLGEGIEVALVARHRLTINGKEFLLTLGRF